MRLWAQLRGVRKNVRGSDGPASNARPTIAIRIEKRWRIFRSLRNADSQALLTISAFVGNFSEPALECNAQQCLITGIGGATHLLESPTQSNKASVMWLSGSSRGDASTPCRCRDEKRLDQKLSQRRVSGSRLPVEKVLDTHVLDLSAFFDACRIYEIPDDFCGLFKRPRPVSLRPSGFSIQPSGLHDVALDRV